MSAHTKTLSVLLLSITLLSFSPTRVQHWQLVDHQLLPLHDRIEGQVIQQTRSGDVNADGIIDRLSLKNGVLTVHQTSERFTTGETLLWQSPPEWEVKQSEISDLDGDGKPEITLLVYRPFEPWPIDRFIPHGGRIASFHDEQGMSYHFVLIAWGDDSFREIWAGSALAFQVKSFKTADLDGDGFQELIVIESDYSAETRDPGDSLSVWSWNGFGFSLVTRQNGHFYDFVVSMNSYGTSYISTIQ